ncbi:non-specific serine,threonine protein kinase, partial [Sarracenia purpurea var. burkii]
QPVGKLTLNPGRAAEKTERTTPGRQEIRDGFSGSVEAFSRRNGSGSGFNGEHSRHRDHSRRRSEDLPSSKVVQADSERGRTSRNDSTSKRVAVSSSRPSSSLEASENRPSRLGSGSGRLSTTQRIQPGFESKSSSFTRSAAATRGSRDNPLRSFELLTIGTGKRK